MEIEKGYYDVNIVNQKVDEIYDTTLKIVNLAKDNSISTYKAADEYALGIIKTAM
jgi:glutamate dehydrogenase/leucine dehydrogenase